MSRADKRQHRECVVGTSQDTTVRLFAFANTRPTYHITFAPESPLIVLKTQRAINNNNNSTINTINNINNNNNNNNTQHPCTQWAPLASLLFHQRPNTTPALYVADTTLVSNIISKEEDVAPIAGPIVRRLANILSKLNPHNATMIAAGVSASLALKYIISGERRLGHSDRLVNKLLLICPPAPHTFKLKLQAMVREHKKIKETEKKEKEYPAPELIILLKDNTYIKEWNELLTIATQDKLIASFSISTNIKPSLFHALLREVGITPDGTTVNLATHFNSPRVYRIDFILSKATKKTEQQITLSPLSTTGCDDDNNNNNNNSDDDEDDESDLSNEENENEESCCSQECDGHVESERVFGLLTLQHCKYPTRIILEGRIITIIDNNNSTIIGTTEGKIIIHGLSEIDKKLNLVKGLAIRVESHIQRDEFGRTSLQALNVTLLTKIQEKRSMTVCLIKEIPNYNISHISNAYGALLIRGRKCVLVRSLNEEFEGMQLPFLFHSDCKETSMECALRALCERCDISPDNFYIPNYFTPVTYYDKSNNNNNKSEGNIICVTIYIAIAITPPSAGAGDTIEDEINPEEPYDWFGYNKALNLLKTEVERVALKDLQNSVLRAYNAGLYIPLKGFGIFGDKVIDTMSTINKTQSLAGLEFMVVCAPGDNNKGYAMQHLRENVMNCIMEINNLTSRDEIHKSALHVLQTGGKTLVLYLSSDVDVNIFSEEELMYWSELEVRPRLITLLLPGISDIMIQDINENNNNELNNSNSLIISTFVYSVILSDALVTVEKKIEDFTPKTWGILQFANKLNNDIMLYAGLANRKLITLSPTPTTILTNNNNNNNNNNKTLHAITLQRVGRPLISTSFSKLIQINGMQECYRHAFLLWAQGEVWLASRPHTRGLITFNPSQRCLIIEEGNSWSDGEEELEEEEEEEEKEEIKENEEKRESFIKLYLWGTSESANILKNAMENMLDAMLCASMSPSLEEAEEDDNLPVWD